MRRIPFIPEKPQRKGAIDQQIDEAMARGEFDNLKGKGKPLDLTADLSDRDTMRSKLRRDANFSAPWEDVAREIEVQTRRTEAELRRTVEFYRAGLHSPKADQQKIEADFDAALRRVAESVKGVNSLILKYNLLIPSQLPHLHRRRVQLRALMEEVAPEYRDRVG